MEERLIDQPNVADAALGPPARVTAIDAVSEVDVIGQPFREAIRARRAAGHTVSAIARALELDLDSVRASLRSE